MSDGRQEQLNEMAKEHAEEVRKGGYVYPPFISNMNDEPYFDANPTIRGITRRDWLAGLAMQGGLTNNFSYKPGELVSSSYAIADAMIAEGNK